jgi:hypothetical protein
MPRPRWPFRKQEKQSVPAGPPPDDGPPRPPPRPHPTAADPALQARLDQLTKRRELVAFDVERAAAAHQPENPWRERIDLLDESLGTIEADLATLDSLPAAPTFPLPESPITEVAATAGEPSSVTFTIGPERFAFTEETDWSERGGPVVRGELRQQAGDAANLVPPETPADRRDALARHLHDSVIVFATDLRDRALDGELLPERPTLADLAHPCPECGGWRDWRGTCDACAERAFRRQQLQAEAVRLATEREEEEADRYKWAERLPIARRRLAEVDAEIARLTAQPGPAR